MRFVLAAAFILTPLPAIARQAPNPVQSILAEAGPGTRWGVLVADESGREILAIDPDKRFMPASNTKLYTTAAALWAEGRDARASLRENGPSVALAGQDVVIRGTGYAQLSSAPDCVTACLATLADAVAVKTRWVRDVVGDAQLFHDERWSPGMSWNNIPSAYGTAVAALSVDDNEMAATVAPGVLGAPPTVALPGYYEVHNRALTVAGDGDTLAFDRAPNSRVLIVTGTLGIAHPSVKWRLGIDDPAGYAAWRFAGMLKDRGVQVSGTVKGRYCEPKPPETVGFAEGSAEPATCGTIGLDRAPVTLARIDPPTLASNLTTINKDSQNLYAELMLRRLGLTRGTGSIAGGQMVVSAMLGEAGVTAEQVTLADGSGMSSYNRVTPRATVKLLQFAARQPWGALYRASLPVGGIDGTLRSRFAGTALQGRIFAKTGTLNATNALAGWLVAASGKVLTFAVYANDVPEEVRATAIMDRALLAIAAAN